MRSSPSALARVFEPLAAGLWVFFVLLSVFVGTVWSFGIGDAQLTRWVRNRELLRTLLWLAQHLDFLWITLAALNTYLCLAQRRGILEMRRWGLAILIGVAGLVWISRATGFPLGRIQYGKQLGAKLGPVPLGLPLFWFAAISGARETFLRYLPRATHGQIALCVGALAALTEFSLEPLAAKLRGLWFWPSAVPTLPPTFDAPLAASLAWGTLAGLLVFAFREKSVVASARPRPWEPVATVVIFHAVFLAAHLGRWMRS